MLKTSSISINKQQASMAGVKKKRIETAKNRFEKFFLIFNVKYFFKVVVVIFLELNLMLRLRFYKISFSKAIYTNVHPYIFRLIIFSVTYLCFSIETKTHIQKEEQQKKRKLFFLGFEKHSWNIFIRRSRCCLF